MNKQTNKQTVFEYLIEQENQDRDFRFDRTNGTGLVVSYIGYKNMNLVQITETLQLHYKLSFDFDRGIEEYDRFCGRTFVYFKNVYDEEQ